MSNMYSLLNYIASTSKDLHDSGSVHSHPYSSHNRSPHNRPPHNILETGLMGLSEDERRMVGISTISAVTRLALEFKMEEVGWLCAVPSNVLLNEHSAGYSPHYFDAASTSPFRGTNCRGCYRLQFG